MGNLFRRMTHIQEVSKEYLEAESESVAKLNQGVLCTIALLYTAVLVFYNIVVPLNFADWGINHIYRGAFIIQVFVLIYTFLRHYKNRMPESIF